MLDGMLIPEGMPPEKSGQVNTISPPMTRSALKATFVILLALTGCKILPTPTEESKAETAAQGFQPDKMVEAIWTTKLVPYLTSKAGPFQEVSALAKKDQKAAGEKYGNPKKQ